MISFRFTDGSATRGAHVYIEVEGVPLLVMDDEHAVSPWQESMEPVEIFVEVK